MAICHFEFTSIARSKGESSVKKAAYIRGTRMLQDRTGETYDYSDKKNVRHCNFLIPMNAPKWLKSMLEAKINNHQTLPNSYNNQNRISQKIWNMSEEVSFKCNARTANSIKVALPAELRIDENIKLLEEFLSDCYVSGSSIFPVECL